MARRATGSHQLLIHRDTQRRAPPARKSADYSCAFLNLYRSGCWVQRPTVDVVECVVANFHFGFGEQANLAFVEVQAAFAR